MLIERKRNDYMLGWVEELERIMDGRQEALKLDKNAERAVSSGVVSVIIDQRHVLPDKHFHF